MLSLGWIYIFLNIDFVCSCFCRFVFIALVPYGAFGGYCETKD